MWCFESFQRQEAFEQVSVPKGEARKVEDKVENKGGVVVL